MIAPDTEHDSIEPVSTASGQAEAGSTQFPVDPVRDIVRVLLAAGLLALCLASPEAGVALLPFVPAIIALRLLRTATQREFLLIVGVIAVIGAALAAASVTWTTPAAAALATLGSLLGLGVAHAYAARPDSPRAGSTDDRTDVWPEPRSRTGFTVALAAWVLLTLLVAALADTNVASLRSGSGDLVERAYSFYTRECADGGSFEERTEFCANLIEQRDSVADFVREHVAVLYAAALALFALGGAATTHLVVLWRARRIHVATRPSRRFAELEVHYGAAYVAAAGLVLLLVAPDSGAVGVLVESLGAGAAVLGGSLLAVQGFGLVAWLAGRRGMRGWQRLMFILVALLVPQVALPLLASLGMVDIAVRPRRRSSATLTGRGTGS